jgi:flavodoxin
LNYIDEEILMKILNLYFSTTGNTQKVAQRIEETLLQLGHSVDTTKVTRDTEVEILDYDFVFIGSGVYTWMPGKPLIDFIAKQREKYRSYGIKPASPRLAGKKAVIYCTFGGGHTGTNEAVPAVKYMGQLFDHLGYDILDEWYIVGEFHGKLAPLSETGRMGNTKGRPNEADLKEVAEKVIGILRV